MRAEDKINQQKQPLQSMDVLARKSTKEMYLLHIVVIGFLSIPIATLSSIIINESYLLLYAITFLILSSFPTYIIIKYYAKSYLLARQSWKLSRKTGIKAVLVTSESKVWHQYIQSKWLPQLSKNIVVINKSHDLHIENVTIKNLYTHFIEDRCPAMLIIKDLNRPLVYEFSSHFRYAKKKNQYQLLDEITKQIFEHLDCN